MANRKLSDSLVLEISKAFSTITAFRHGDNSAYNYAKRHSLLSKMTWLQPKNHIYTDEEIMSIGRKYEYVYDFYHDPHDRNAYNAANRRGLLKKMTWLKSKKNPLHDNMYVIYVYIKDQFAYVGLTMNPVLRHQQHRKSGPVYNLFNGEVVKPIYLESDLTAEDAQAKELFYIEQYTDKGYTVINKAPTGKGTSSLGAVAAHKWSKSKVFEVSHKYKTRIAFSEGEPTAYVKAVTRGWLKEMTWLEYTNTQYTVESALEKASHYKNAQDLSQNGGGCYQFLRKMKLLGEIKYSS